METTLIVTGGALLGCLIGLSWFAGSDAPYVATKSSRIKKALKKAGLKKGDLFYELGSGDGRVVIEAAKMGAKAYGIEQSYLRILYSRLQASKLKNGKAYFIHGNIFNQDLSKADVVFIFLLPKGVLKLEDRLKKELKKGAIIITQTFHFPHWKPHKKILVTDKGQPNATLGPNKVEGDFWIYQR